jgi:hypothetical protein
VSIGFSRHLSQLPLPGRLCWDPTELPKRTTAVVPVGFGRYLSQLPLPGRLHRDTTKLPKGGMSAGFSRDVSQLPLSTRLHRDTTELPKTGNGSQRGSVWAETAGTSRAALTAQLWDRYEI